jgi:mono/diheme cytochrome c family protein
MRYYLLIFAFVINTAVQADADNGLSVYQDNCLACHMYDRRGVSGMAPTLLNSPWIIGSDELLAGYLLTGGFGPQVLMARFDYLTNEDLRDLIEYLRLEEGLDTAIDTEQIQQIRIRYQGEGLYD